MSTNVWQELQKHGVPRDAIFPVVEKAFVPAPNLPKSQFRDHLLKACRKVTGKPLAGDEAMDICLIADEIWDRWPGLD